MSQSTTPGNIGESTSKPSPRPASKADAAREQAREVGQGATQAGSQVAQTAVEQGKELAAEAGRQTRNLAAEARSQVHGQAAAQQRRAASGLHGLGDELESMARQGGQSGLASELVAQAADRSHRFAGWLEQREPGSVLDEVRSVARRHPGAFLAGAAVAGVVFGRLTRGAVAAGSNGDSGTGRDGDTSARWDGDTSARWDGDTGARRYDDGIDDPDGSALYRSTSAAAPATAPTVTPEYTDGWSSGERL